MKFSLPHSLALATIAAAALVACGGGGGSAGSTPGTGTGTGTGTGGGTTATTHESATINVLDAQDNPTVYVNAAETSRVRVSVTDKSGAPAIHSLVKISAGNSLVSFLPAVGQLLTDASGVAEFSLKPESTSAVGAVVLTTEATLADGSTVTGTKNIQLTNSNSGNVAVDPQTLVRSIGLSSVNPSDKSIVIRGSGGSGRSETASVSFKLLDANGTPVKGALVNFSINNPSNPNVANLNIASAVSDLDGVVTTTLNSGTSPGTVVVVARVANTNITSQSDQITVTTSVATQAGFEIVADTYNLNGRLTGDKTSLRAYLRDVNGNPVADGVAVVFTTNFGRVGSSDRGACVTQNGSCSVDFMVQNPRGSGWATVVASANTGTGTATLANSLNINMAAASSTPRVAPTAVSVGQSCLARAAFTVHDGSTSRAGEVAPRALPAGTTIGATVTDDPNVRVSVVEGGNIRDSLDFTPTDVILDFNTGSAGCNAQNPQNNTQRATATARIRMTLPRSTVTFDQNVTINYMRQP